MNTREDPADGRGKTRGRASRSASRRAPKSRAAAPAARTRGLRPGKVPFDLLQDLVRGIGERDDVILGPAVGEDAAIVRVERSRVVAASDPITFVTDQLGWYAVQANANDIAASGADPRWFIAVVMLPIGTPKAELTRVFRDIRRACADVGAVLVGGHTEVTDAVTRPVISGTMLGESPANRPARTGTARPGDRIVVTKGVAIEGAAILAREFRERSTEILGERGAATVRRYLRRPGLSVVPEARIARAVPGVHAMHDLTEGGAVAGIVELAKSSGLGARIDLGRIPVLPGCARLCDAFGLDPYRTISSGALLVAVSPADEADLLTELGDGGIESTAIGEMTVTPDVVAVDGNDNDDCPLSMPARDEIARFFESTRQ